MSILTNAEQIRDEVAAGANTAARVGGNLVEVANDLLTKQAAITINSAKVGISTSQASAITDNATAASTNAAAILTKLGKSTSTIAVSEVDVLTAAAYTALATKVSTKLYFTT